MKILKTHWLLILLLTGTVFGFAHAGEVKILAAEFIHNSDRDWMVSVTLSHADSGWDHYADDWRIVDAEGRVLADRVLAHPHINEQPFSRSLGHVELPTSGRIYIEAHDRRHGWASPRLSVNMAGRKQANFQVKAD